MSSFELLSLVLVWNRLIDHWYSALICSFIMAIAAGSLAISVRRIVRQYHIDDTVDATPTLGGENCAAHAAPPQQRKLGRQ